METKNKFVLPILIILLIIFTPLSAYGTYKYILNKMEAGNPSHAPKVGNILYFYDSNDKLIGTYTCENSNCAMANSEIDDEYLDYYTGMNNTLSTFDNYAFINDNGLKLLSLNQNQSMVVGKFNLIKNYGTTLENNVVLIKNEDNDYGIFSLDTGVYTLSPAYDFLGLANNFNDGVLSASKFAASNDDEWFILSIDGQELTEKTNIPIYYYNDNIIVYINDNKYYITNYDLTLLFDEDINLVKINSSYLVFSTSNKVYVYDKNMQKFYQKYDATSFTLDNSQLTLLDENGQTIEIVDLTTLKENEVSSNDLKTIASDVINSAQNAVKYDAVEDKDICFSISYLINKNYYSNSTNLTGSVYLKYISEDNYKSYIWISDYQNSIGVYNKESFIGGVYSESLDKYLINTKTSASNNCGNLGNNQNIVYFN